MSIVLEQDEAKPSTEGLVIVEKMPKQMLLVKLIGKEEPIYDHHHEDYRNILKKDDLWKKIAETVGWTEHQCKAKWKAMRDQYCRELKRTRDNPKACIKWKYFPHMEFLRPHALYRRSLYPVTSSYHPKMPTGSENGDHSQQEDTMQDDEMSSINEQLCPTAKVKSEDWKIYSNSSEINDSTTQFMVEIEQNMEGEAPQDDEDDDPIHTFLNIESYFENELIAMVKAEQILYNNRHRAYRNVKLKLQIWEEIARKLKRTVRQCRTKWKALRDQYIREHKRLLQSDNGRYLQRWKHYDALKFLENYVRQRNDIDGTLENITKPEISLSNDDLDQEQMIAESTEEDHERSHYITADQGTSQIFIKSNFSKHSHEEDPIDEEATVEFSTESDLKDDDDEIGVFFRAIAMKIRNAKMPAMAFTELQIDILRVITKALRD